MGLFDQWLKPQPKVKTKAKGDVQFSQRYSDIFYSRLGRINNYDENARTYIEQGYQQNPIVYAIASNIARSGSQARWYIKDKRTGQEVNHPVLSRVMEKPNSDKTWVDLMQDLLTDKIVGGNSFLSHEVSVGGLNDGMTNFLYRLPYEDMQIIPTKDLRGISGYQVDSAWTEGEIIPADEVLHLKNPNPDFDEAGTFLFGQSAFRAASRSIQTYNEALDTGVWFLANKGSQKLLFNKNPEQELGPEGADALKNKLRQQSQGPKNSANIPFIDEEVGVLDISASAQDALVLEQKESAAREIAACIGFPISLLGYADATYQNAKEAKKSLWGSVIMPELNEIASGLNRWLVPQFGKHLELCYDVSHIDALQEDRLMRGKAIKEYAGLVTINTAREMAGLKTYDWMKEPTSMEEFKEQMYLGFTQAVVSDQEEISPSNGEQDESKTDKK